MEENAGQRAMGDALRGEWGSLMGQGQVRQRSGGTREYWGSLGKNSAWNGSNKETQGSVVGTECRLTHVETVK